MQKNMKKLVSTLGAIAFVATAFGLTAMNAETAKAEEVSLAITGKTLTVSSNVNVSFFVPVEAGNKDEITVKVAESDVDGEYVTLTATAENYKDEDKGTEYYEFIYKGVMAYEMANNLYAYAEKGTEKSETVKYSVLQYAYKKLGMANAEKDTTKGLDTLLNAMLSYGSAAAQFNNKTEVDYLNDYTYVSIANATFDDGFAYGLFKKGETVNVNVNEGYELSKTADDMFAENNGIVTLTVPDDCFIDDEESPTFVEEGLTISDEEKVDYELENVNFTTKQVEKGDQVTLDVTPEAYEDVTITWNATNATVNGNVVTFNTVGKATVWAIVSCGETVKESRKFTVEVTAKTLATFEFGANGSASHNDGTEKNTYSETSNGYTLNLTSMSKVYSGARDAKGNSCIKLGTSSAVGSFTMTVPSDVVKVVFKVAKYKANASKISINGTNYTLSNSSNDGAYDVIEIDTTTTKTITFATVSGGVRAMVNSVVFMG